LKDLAAAEARIVEAVLIRDEAMKKQAAAVQQNLGESSVRASFFGL